MHALASIFFQVSANDAYSFGRITIGRQIQVTFETDRQVVLADLIALGQVGIEVVLAIPLVVSAICDF